MVSPRLRASTTKVVGPGSQAIHRPSPSSSPWRWHSTHRRRPTRGGAGPSSLAQWRAYRRQTTTARPAPAGSPPQGALAVLDAPRTSTVSCEAA
jgi:hypothetical protein